MIDAEALFGLLRQKPTITNEPGAQELVYKEGQVAFRDVEYDPRRKVLKGLDFEAFPNWITAIVGKSGEGKSTILDLLLRFYDPTAGTIYVDGQDISKVTLDSLIATLGIVPQSPELFGDTIMANVRFGRLDATDEEVMDACKAAAIHDKIMSFPDRYNTVVGDGGPSLSRGEQQRVAIARVILKNPKIVLLDEVTASLDSETESQVQQGLQRLSTGRTTIIIAHRLSTIKKADQILVVGDGKIIERGTHTELLRRDGYYRHLCDLQDLSTLDKEELSSTSS
ncbi:heavy metal tolerance protein [Coccidioides posadasii str. Silveira]|uniref:Heavy metal tolerance protein n=2 Tax=Coccidioides posadasii (strain RMSCC 757 / Silveira) TaxID=443226 RepID=E9D566_COCPS|nr:heavy metal tolerance protein [Coccidioides posadasii str. Silveira]